jgi:hypothetical protein
MATIQKLLLKATKQPHYKIAAQSADTETAETTIKMRSMVETSEAAKSTMKNRSCRLKVVAQTVDG